MQGLNPKQDCSVAAVVINYNGGDHVQQCLRSLREQSVPVQVVVVDNASQDDSLERIRKNFPEATIIANDFNAGWAQGCNIGIEATTTPFVMTVNNDAYLDPRCAEEMLIAIERDPGYGACASKILLWDKPDTIEVASLVIYPDGAGVGRGRLQPATLYNDVEEVFCANDCCCLYRRKLLDHVGLYDPDFFMYCNETDLGWRHQSAGWKCIYAPRAIAYHAHSTASGDYSDFKAYHFERNRLFLVMKYFPLPAVGASFVYAARRYWAQWRLSRLGKGALGRYRESNSLGHGLSILLKAHWDALKWAPTMLRRRRAYAAFRVMDRRDFARMFERFGVSANDIAGYE